MFGVLFLLLLFRVINTMYLLLVIVLGWAGYICFKSKNDILHAISKFSKMIVTQFNSQVKVFLSDNGCEFVN